MVLALVVCQRLQTHRSLDCTRFSAPEPKSDSQYVKTCEWNLGLNFPLAYTIRPLGRPLTHSSSRARVFAVLFFLVLIIIISGVVFILVVVVVFCENGAARDSWARTRGRRRGLGVASAGALGTRRRRWPPSAIDMPSQAHSATDTATPARLVVRSCGCSGKAQHRPSAADATRISSSRDEHAQSREAALSLARRR